MIRNNIYKILIAFLLMMVVGVNSAWGQSLPFEVTTNAEKDSQTEKLYWIESVGATGFYAVPHSNNTNASTTNVPTLRALWFFMESGEDDGYYYIINKETGKYLKKTGTAGDDNTVQVAAYATADDVKFKFSFGIPDGVEQGNWVIYPKDNTGNSQTGWLSKKSGNLEYAKWLKSSIWGDTPVGDLNSQWKIVARTDVQWPRSGLPFVASTSSDKHYYRIKLAENTDYKISYDSDNYVTISNDNDNIKAWYFEEAATDPNIDNLKYYYIVNAATGKYLKFTSTDQNINGNNQDDKFKLLDYNDGDTDRFQFVVVNSYGGNPGYSIMPKLAMSKFGVNKYANSIVPSTVANNERLDLRSDRNNNNAHWTFEAVWGDPVVTCDLDGQITIDSGESGAVFYYTTDGSTVPTEDPSLLYSESSKPSVSAGITTIKIRAIASGKQPSNVVTKTIIYNPTISLSDNPSVYDGNAKTLVVKVGDDVVASNKYTPSYKKGGNVVDAIINAGTYEVVLTDVEEDDDIVCGSGNVVVAKADITPVVTMADWTYGNVASNPDITGNLGNGTVTYLYKVQDADDATYVETKPENAGSYTVKATIAETENSNGGTTTANFVINKADICPVVTMADWTYGDAAPDPVVTGNLGEDEVTVTYLYKVQGADDATYVETKPENVGSYTIKATIPETTNYNAGSATANFKINGLTFNLVVTISGWTFGDIAATPSISGKEGDGAVSYSYKVKDAEDNTYTSDVPTNAGDYTIMATVAASGNYAQVEATADFTITKAALTVTANNNTITYGDVPAGNGVTCDGFVNSETESVLGGTLDYDYSYTQYDDVGNTYTITPKGLISTNYEITFVKGKLTVAAKEVGITWENTEFTYNGEEQAPTATATGLVNNDEIGVMVSGAQRNAGTGYNATASSLTGPKASNYKLPEANTQSFTILQKNIGDGTTMADGYIFDFGVGNTILLTDVGIGSTLVLDTDYSVSDIEDDSKIKYDSDKYSERTVTGKGNYKGSFDVRNVVISLTTDTDQEEWSATFAAEKEKADASDIGLALPEGVMAFIISGIRGEWAIPEPLDYIPEGVPVLLVARKQINGFVPVKAEIAEVTEITDAQKTKNMLEEVTASTSGYNPDTQSAPFTTKQIYLLYKNEFVFNKAGNLKKGKVYLNPNHTVSASPDPAPARLQIAWNSVTGIKDGRWKMEDGRSERWYTIDGRRLSGKPDAKGLYIVNGKKIAVK